MYIYVYMYVRVHIYIYIAFILYLKLFTQNQHCIRYYTECGDDLKHVGASP